MSLRELTKKLSKRADGTYPISEQNFQIWAKHFVLEINNNNLDIFMNDMRYLNSRVKKSKEASWVPKLRG